MGFSIQKRFPVTKLAYSEEYKMIKMVIGRFEFSVLAFIIISCMGCDPKPKVPAGPSTWNELPESNESVETTSTASDLATVLKNDRVIINIFVDWSTPSLMSREIVLRLKREVMRDERLNDVVFRGVDCSAQHGDVWRAISNWLSIQENGRMGLRTDSWGAVLWIKNGRLIDSVDHAVNTGGEKLISITRRIFLSQGGV